MLKTVCILIFLIPAICAANLQLSQDKGQLIVTGESCEELQLQRQAICQWKRELQPAFSAHELKTPHCSKSPKSKFQIKISECLPEFVKNHMNKKLYHHGANCWGTAMSFKNISQTPRFIWSEEMLYWLESPLCRKLEVNEQRLPGDIMVIYGPEHLFADQVREDAGSRFWEAFYPGRITPAKHDRGYTGHHSIFHAETYLTEHLTFGKTSPNKDDRFQFSPMNEVYAIPRDSECLNAQDKTPYLREYQKPPKSDLGQCPYLSNLYRCQNINIYLNNQKLTEREYVLQQEIELLKSEQDSLFNLILSSQMKLSKNEIKRIINLSDKTTSSVLQELRNFQNETVTEMLLVQKYFSAAGLRKSLEFAKIIKN